MTPTIGVSASAPGASLRRARRERVRMIRRRVIAGALALFVAVWLLITVMLVTGHDPALARARDSTVILGSAATNTTTTNTTTSSSTGSIGSTSALTSRQS